MSKISPLKLQRNLFGKHSSTQKDPEENVHTRIYANDQTIRHMSRNGKSTGEIALTIHVPRVRIRQYMKYHHIYCTPKQEYYQENMFKLIPYIKHYKRLTIVAKKLNLSYSALYVAYRNYKQAPSKHTSTHQNMAHEVISGLKANHNKMQRLEHQNNYYKFHYKHLKDKYNEVINLLHQYM